MPPSPHGLELTSSAEAEMGGGCHVLARWIARAYHTASDSLINEYVWSQIEPAVAILCGCLVTYRPLFRNMTLSLPKQLQRFSHSSQTGNPSEDTPSTKERDLEFKWPAARGLRGQALSYQGLYSKVNKNGVHVYNINPPSSQVETTCRVSISKFAKEVTNKPQSITVTRENSITVNTEI
ncbi:MAG: hypothetical protein LQ342_002886 [Letrouitia transgressa]|nr:MAG: hypothetical protein LQ342_002886 [Letrouitia transgressa]